MGTMLSVPAIDILDFLERSYLSKPQKFWSPTGVLIKVLGGAGKSDRGYLQELIDNKLVVKDRRGKVRYNSLGPT